MSEFIMIFKKKTYWLSLEDAGELTCENLKGQKLSTSHAFPIYTKVY